MDITRTGHAHDWWVLVDRRLFHILAFVVFSALVYLFLPVDVPMEPGMKGPIIGVDWKGAFRPSAIEMLLGGSPFIGNIFNPPWIIAMLIPIAVLPAPVGSAFMFSACIFSFFLVARRLGANLFTAFILALSPPALSTAINGNIDWMIAIGFILPPWLGLFFVMAKPQIGIAYLIFMLFETYRDGGFYCVLKMIFLLLTAYALSFLIYGPWIVHLIRPDLFSPGKYPTINMSVWPIGLPIGFVLLYYALRSRQKGFAIAASPFFSPYVSLLSWSVPLLGLLPRQREAVVAVVGFWIVWALDGKLLWMFERLGIL